MLTVGPKVRTFHAFNAFNAFRPTRKMSLMVRRSTKSPQELNEMMHQALDTANKACNDPKVTDTECLVLWDVVDDISKAYNKAVDEVLTEELKNKKPKREYFLVPKDMKK
jgi:mannose-6-phosphate isomerase class I